MSDVLRVIRVPLIAVGGALLLFWVSDLRTALFWFVVYTMLTITRWAEWRYWPHLRFRVLPRRWFR